MRILAISPHPDDVEYSISGILLKTRKRIENVSITIAYNTKYDLGDNDVTKSHDIRKREAKMACRLLNAEYVEYSLNDSLASMAKMILDIMPDIVFLPYSNDSNCIHREVTANFIKAIEVARKSNLTNINLVGQLFYYEAYSCESFEADYFIDVSEVFCEARKILMCHKVGINSLKSLPYKFDIVHRLNGLKCAMPYGEGFMRDKSTRYQWKSNMMLLAEFLYKLVC